MARLAFVSTPRSAAPSFLARLSFCNLRRALRDLSQIACSYLLFWRSVIVNEKMSTIEDLWDGLEVHLYESVDVRLCIDNGQRYSN
jgi:hypothetical protein